MLKLNKTKKGTLLYHHLYGVVKFVKFNYGTCCVENEQYVLYPKNIYKLELVKIIVMSYNLTKYNKKEYNKK